ncbi:hypothetical protein FB45DRAFT_828791 [Roridomyces roridus]|uniref:F-box domain-containing protein n=1 Tax=Roridomyces roridus TaxID=1738132 RepID=A0AAD7C1H3_9AGAR|nr:hypothetical protein FB45DRAFT_828791 [Roridomyces roridus]
MASNATATALREQLSKISGLLSLQSPDLRRDLEQQRNTAQRKLNDILDPIRRLPPELIADIFLRCLPDQRTVDFEVAPLVLLHVCHAWKHFAETLPALWTELIVDTDRMNSEGYNSIVESWISRAGGRSLALSLEGHETHTPRVLEPVDGCAEQIQALQLDLSSPEDLDAIIALRRFPSMTNLTLARANQWYCDSDDEADEYPWSESWEQDATVFIRMLNAAANLVECRLVQINDFTNSPPHIFTHSTLTHPHLGRFPGVDVSSSSAYMLSYLTLPALAHLTMASCDLEFQPFSDFLTHVTPQQFLALIPNVVELHLFSVDPAFNCSLIEAIGTGLLPKISCLTIDAVYPGLRPHYLRILDALGALCARSHGLSSFSFLWNVTSSSEDGRDVYAELTPEI